MLLNFYTVKAPIQTTNQLGLFGCNERLAKQSTVVGWNLFSKETINQLGLFWASSWLFTLFVGRFRYIFTVSSSKHSKNSDFCRPTHLCVLLCPLQQLDVGRRNACWPRIISDSVEGISSNFQGVYCWTPAKLSWNVYSIYKNTAKWVLNQK